MTGCQLQAQGYFICSVFYHQSVWQTVAGKTTAYFWLSSYSHLSRKSSWINKITHLFLSKKGFEFLYCVVIWLQTTDDVRQQNPAVSYVELPQWCQRCGVLCADTDKSGGYIFKKAQICFQGFSSLQLRIISSSRLLIEHCIPRRRKGIFIILNYCWHYLPVIAKYKSLLHKRPCIRLP